MSQWNDRLRHERIRRNWRQQDLADHLGTTIITVQRWERGSHRPSAYFRIKLCALFDISAEEFGFVSSASSLFLMTTEVREVTPPSILSLSTAETPSRSPDPTFWNVPFLRNPLFTGREEILQTLHALLNYRQSITSMPTLALSGLGGIGKTQVAVEYAYRYASEYQAVLWLTAGSSESLVSRIQQIAALLHLPEYQAADQVQIVAAVQRWLATHPGWLLIADNVEDIDQVRTMLPAKWQGALLLTTRQQALGTSAEPLALPPMTMHESAILLWRRAHWLFGGALDATVLQGKSLETSIPAGTLEVVQFLEGLPLALDQAGAYIEETGCSIADYLQRFRSQRKEVLAHRGRDKGTHPDSVSVTLRLAIEHIERVFPAAAELLRLCAFLHPEAIAEDLLVEGAPHLGPVLSPVVKDAYRFDLALAALRSASLVTRHPEMRMLSLHQLVQAVIHDQMNPAEIQVWQKRVVYMVHDAFPESTPETWERCERYLAQALACVPLIELVTHNLSMTGEFLSKVGSYLLERGRYGEAEPLLEQAVLVGEQELGSDHLALVPRLLKWEALFWKQGKYEQAKLLLQRMLAIEEQHLGPTHLQTATTLGHLAYLYWYQGNYEQAEAFYQQVLSIRQQHLGSSHTETANSLSGLAVLYYDLKKYQQAEFYFQQAHRIREQRLGSSHPLTVFTLNGLANAYREQGKYELAEVLYQQVLQMREHQVGPQHLETAQCLTDLGMLYQKQGRYEPAEVLYQRAFSIQEQQAASEHPGRAITLTAMAMLYQKQGKYEQAEALYQQALHIRERQWGPEHPMTALILTALVTLYRVQGKHKQAEAFLQHTLSIREKQ
ncbi:MAG TPA: FxSxx-COOH system tetratricopeptide repeat protein [Ktedonobacteraceae bacterium]